MAMDAYYAGGRVAVLSLKLWTKDKFLRLADCADISAAMRMLSESGYGGGVEEGSDFEQILQKELVDSVAFLNEMSPDRKVTDCFLLVYDYTNVKNMMKCKYLRRQPQNLFSCGLFDVDQAWQSIAVDDYKMFSEEMQQALNEIDRQFVEGNRYPSVIDKLLDKAYFAEIFRRNKSVRLASVKNYWKLSTDIANILLLLRAKRASLSVDKKDFAVGGTQLALLQSLTEADFQQISQAFEKDELGKFVSCACNAAEDGKTLSEAMQIAEEMKRQTLLVGKENFTAEPVICYFLSKTTEIDNIRTIMICLKNNVSKQYLKQAVKELYV